ncbi:MAG: hypothetical protein HOH33_17820 [Verrucomicrobia bacterium]|jgi:lysophospholipase L1-like esterase/pimeloyl-ACP methyl ester carboxylesterase|nr:hypothetical protein [Verrucomicrobiota bacterium]
MPSQILKKWNDFFYQMSLRSIYIGLMAIALMVQVQGKTLRVACVGDSITQGARVDADTQSYPARLAEILGSSFEIRNFGVGGATLIRSGTPNIWSKLEAIESFEPHFVVIALGTNDTVEGGRRNWSMIDQFQPDCREWVGRLLDLPSQPTVCLAGPTPMVLETPGLSEQRRTNLQERKPRLEQLRAILREVVASVGSKRLFFLDLGPVLNGRPELLTEGDGVHPNIQGYQEIALEVARSIQTIHQGSDQEVRTDLWEGYQRQHFKVQGKSAWVVLPLKAAEGRPWIWRARFPGFHAEMDHQLVGHGFHVGYVDVAGLFGAQQAMDTGDTFYDFVTKRYQLSRQPVMEGVSRGGLFVYHWALQHPESVSAIYCDTPVCDPKSWPGGQGEGIGSARDWKRFMLVNGLTVETAQSFKAPVFENYEILIQHQIPIMHIISDNDTVVPPLENTLRLKTLLEQKGHSMDLLRVAEGTTSSHGHHFTHPQPDRVVRFIKTHAQ